MAMVVVMVVAIGIAEIVIVVAVGTVGEIGNHPRVLMRTMALL